MAEYCVTQDIANRLTAVGMLNVADRNKDGIIGPDEETSYVTPAIQYAGNVIDGYVCGQILPAVSRGASNPWLRDRCIDLAVYQACAVGGREVPKSVKEIRDNTIRMLEAIQEGQQIPGFPYPGPSNAPFVRHAPKVANIGRCAGRRSTPRTRGNWPNY